MAHKVSIIVIHGMGGQEEGYSDEMRELIEERLGADNANRLKWEEVLWADILEPHQRDYLNRASAKNDLDFIKLRKFVVASIGDAAAYRNTPDKKDTTYQEIHERVRLAIEELDEPGEKARLLVVIAHSLGGHIMSNYIWDMQKPNSPTAAGLNDFQSMKTVAGMVTFGCNIPLFTFAYDPDDIKPIKFPGSKLPPAVKQKARWLNFYDADDVLGYPLKPISKAYQKVINRDIEINVGGFFSNWNPMSHTKYWTDKDFIKPVSRFITSLL